MNGKCIKKFKNAVLVLCSAIFFLATAFSCHNPYIEVQTTNTPGQTPNGGTPALIASEAQTATPVVIHATHTPGPTPSYTEVNGWKCIDSTTDFLYQMTEIDRYDDVRYHFDDIYPQYPWIGVAVIPDNVITDTRWLGTQNLRIIRQLTNEKELWIQNGINYIRYSSSSGKFTTIDGHPTDFLGGYYSDAKVTKIFVLPDGRILGLNYPIDYDPQWPDGIPFLSVFNDDLNEFQFFDIGLLFPYNKVIYAYEGGEGRYGTIINFDGSILWVYQQEDGLFSYDFTTDSLNHYLVSFKSSVRGIAVSPEGQVLFLLNESWGWDLKPGDLVMFDPVTQTSTNLSVPVFPWPNYGNLLYTESGDLWIGIHGYRSKDGEWNLLNPKSAEYKDLGATTESYNWHQPDLALLSSDGVLWYTNSESDGLGVIGAAWYNPENNTSCWFTTEYGNIVEDEDHILWMVTGNRIYQYSLPGE